MEARVKKRNRMMLGILLVVLSLSRRRRRFEKIRRFMKTKRNLKTRAPRATTIARPAISRLRRDHSLTVLERYSNWTYVQYGTLTVQVMNDYVVYDAGESDSDAPNGDENGDEKGGDENGGGQAAAQVAIVLPSGFAEPARRGNYRPPA